MSVIDLTPSSPMQEGDATEKGEKVITTTEPRSS